MSAPDPFDKPPEKKSISDKFKSFADKKNVDNFLDYTRTHTREVSAFVLLTLGIIFLFILPILGQALIGIVAAIFFNNELLDLFHNFNKNIDAWGIDRCIVLIGLTLAFFIEAPVIFIAAGFTMGLKHLFEAGNRPTNPPL